MQNREQHQNIHALNAVTEPASERVIWDDVIQCLGQRTRGARKTWIVQTRIDGKTRKRTLGSASEITVSHARELAVNILG